MDPLPYVQACAAADLDQQTGVCASPYWVQQQPSLFPSLSAAQGGEIGVAIVAVWAIGFGIKCMRRVLFQS